MDNNNQRKKLEEGQGARAAKVVRIKILPLLIWPPAAAPKLSNITPLGINHPRNSLLSKNPSWINTPHVMLNSPYFHRHMPTFAFAPLRSEKNTPHPTHFQRMRFARHITRSENNSNQGLFALELTYSSR